jgi:hypothetical protein
MGLAGNEKITISIDNWPGRRRRRANRHHHHPQRPANVFRSLPPFNLNNLGNLMAAAKAKIDALVVSSRQMTARQL